MGIIEKVLRVFGRRSDGADRSFDALGEGAAERVRVEARALAPVLSDILEKVAATVQAGTTTLTIDQGIEGALDHAGLEPIMKGYHGYPMSSTVSVNQEILHAIPSSRRVGEGDLVKIKTAGSRNGVCVAQAWTFPVGHVSAEDARMLSTATRALRAAEAVVRAGARVGDIGAAIQGTVESEGLAVIRTFVGSGIGRQLHEEPPVPCYGVSGQGRRLTAGQLFHIQVILKQGTPDVAIAEDGWAAFAVDGRRGVIKSCMMEVERDGCRLLGRFLDEPAAPSLLQE